MATTSSGATSILIETDARLRIWCVLSAGIPLELLSPGGAAIILTLGQTRFTNLAENVEQKLMRFLDSRSGVAGDDQIDIGQAFT